MRRLFTITIASLALAAPLLISGAASAQAPSPLDIKPGKLARGADISVPHLDGTTIVDGAIRIKLDVKRVLLYGKWNNAYIAALGNAQWGNVRLARVAKNGAVKVLREGIDPFNAVLDAEADQVAYSFGDATPRCQHSRSTTSDSRTRSRSAGSRRCLPCSSSMRASPSPRSQTSRSAPSPGTPSPTTWSS